MSVPVPVSVPRSNRSLAVSLPPNTRLAPLATTTPGAAVKRPALAKLRLPLVTLTLSAAACPAKRLAPVELSAPAPRFAFAVLAPLLSA